MLFKILHEKLGALLCIWEKGTRDIYPSIFLEVLDLVEGVAVTLVYGILPCLIMIKTSKSANIKKLAVLLLIIFIFISIMLLEIGKESGLLLSSSSLMNIIILLFSQAFLYCFFL